MLRELTDSPRGSVADMLGRWHLRWPAAMTIGARLDDMVVIDLDVDDPLADDVMSAIADIAPEVHARAPTRYGASKHKRALFCRWQEARNHSGGWPATSTARTRHCVEVFGGGRLKGDKCSRRFGIYGPHSYNADGSVAAEYRWDAAVPALHESTTRTCRALQGPKPRRSRTRSTCWPGRPAGPGRRRWRTPARAARGSTTSTRRRRALTYWAAATRSPTRTWSRACGARPRSGTGWRAPTGQSATSATARCTTASWSTTTRPRRRTTRSSFPVDPSALAGELKALLPQPVEPPEPGPGEDLETKAAWLVDTRGYLEAEDRVVALYATSLDCRTTPAAQPALPALASGDPVPGRRQAIAYATDLWELTPARCNLSGVRMRPDQPFPVYEENGRTFKNTYRRPVHASGTNVAPFVSFMERFIPDPVERNWLLDWMAHKQAHPEIPGTAVFLVADTDDDTREGKFGTGRGLFFTMLHRLYGEDYTRSEDFNILDGTSSQSAYTDWIHGSVLVTVDEAKTSATSYRRGERNAAYEILKNIVDPAPKRRSFKGKHRQAFDGMAYASYVVATNHANAAAIPESDRRFTVLRNGDVMTRPEAIEIVAWMAEGANVGALSQYLAARDLSGFDMMAPLATAGKAEMAELARSEVEEVLRDLIDDETRGKVFAKAHIEMIVEHNFNGQGAFWRGEFAGCWQAYCVGLKGPKGSAIRVRMLGTQRKLFCFRRNHREVMTMPEAAIQREVRKWGHVDPATGPTEVAGPNIESE